MLRWVVAWYDYERRDRLLYRWQSPNISSFPSPVPSLSVRPGFDIPAPERYYTAVEEDSAIECTASKGAPEASTSKGVAEQPKGAIKVGEEGVIAETVWDGKARNLKKVQVLSPVHG